MGRLADPDIAGLVAAIGEAGMEAQPRANREASMSDVQFCRHPGESRDPCFSVTRVDTHHVDGWTPAFAGVTEK